MSEIELKPCPMCGGLTGTPSLPSGRSATMISEKANDLVAAYGEACHAFAWFRPHSLRDMLRAENELVGFIALLASRDAALRKAMEPVQNAVNSGEHPDYILGQVQVYAIMPELRGEGE